MTEDAEDRRSIERMAGADEAALRELFSRHGQRVYRFVVRRAGNEALARELVNDVFLDAWRGAGRYEGRSSVATWLLSIARNKCVSALRRRKEESLDEEAASEIGDAGDDPEVSAQKGDKAVVLRRCIDRLSPEHREIVDLVYYHELSVLEASEVVGIPEGTVKTRLFGARKQLSELARAAGLDRGWP